MKREFYLFITIAFALFGCASTQNIPISDDLLKVNLKRHITVLASDSYEGRETGTLGEKKSYEYITKQLKKAGAKGKGSKGFLQAFPFTAGHENGNSTQLIVNSTIYKYGIDFYPLAYSANGIATGYITRLGYGISDSKNSYDDYKGKVNISKRIFIIYTGTPDGNDPHGKLGEWMDLRKKIDVAVSKGAAAVIFISKDSTSEDIIPDWKNHTSPSSIPVFYAKGNAAMVLKDSVVTNCTAGAEIIKIERQGHNVIGLVNNKAKNTVVIGAHYDHLGFGDGGSLHRGEPAIHNGADDNASGIAALIELAAWVKRAKLKKYNYLFIAFSGEEKGLLGSNYFVKNPTIGLQDINYMINMDMVGRLKPDEKVLIVNGTGTSERWKDVIQNSKPSELRLRETESGVGPSDHTSFYLKDIPVLHFFSGTHNDYHKPSDDEEKINYDGTVLIIKMIKNIVSRLDSADKLIFTKTKNNEGEETPRFKVTLGVVPDYAFEGEGMRIDGVSEGKPASNAGLQPGDVVIQLGEHKVHDMMSYMKALGKFNKGETTKVKVIRNKMEVVSDITF